MGCYSAMFVHDISVIMWILVLIAVGPIELKGKSPETDKRILICTKLLIIGVTTLGLYPTIVTNIAQLTLLRSLLLSIQLTL